MDDELREKLTALKFQDHSPEGMKGGIEDISIVAVVHPLKGLALLVSHRDARSITYFEEFISPQSTLQEIAAALVRIYEVVHPERRTKGITSARADGADKEGAR